MHRRKSLFLLQEAQCGLSDEHEGSAHCDSRYKILSALLVCVSWKDIKDPIEVQQRAMPLNSLFCSVTVGNTHVWKGFSGVQPKATISSTNG